MQTARKQLWNVAALLVIFTMLLSATFVFSATPVLAQDEPPTSPQAAGDLPLDDPSAAEVGQADPETGALLAQADQSGRVRVIVVLNVPDAPDTGKPVKVYAAAQDALEQSMKGYTLQNVYRYENFPLVAMQVDAPALRALLANRLVSAVQEDSRNEITLADSSKIVGAVEAAQAGYTGNGVTLAIIDTGVDKTHPFFGGRVIEEACFSGADGLSDADGYATSLCPNGLNSQIGSGAGVNCQFPWNAAGADGCRHGTHVAGIAAGQGATFSGIARNANIIAINVFSRYHYYGNGNDYLSTFDSDYIKALDHVYSLRTIYNISSVNMSLGGSIKYTGYCDKVKPAVKKAIDRLRLANIATVIAAGNSSWTNGLASPACVSSAVSVGSTEKDDTVSSFSNSATYLNLLAPGGQINSSVPGNAWDVFNGTSMAAPHVTGAWAVLRQAFPTKNVSTILALLKSTGVAVKDYRNGKVKPRINIAYAIGKYQKPTVAPTLDAPAEGATLTNSTPELSWFKLPLVSSYKVTIKRNGTSVAYTKLLKASDICPFDSDLCSVHVPTVLKTGMHTWMVQPYSGAGGGPASAPRTFYTPNMPPFGVNLTFPVMGVGYYSPHFEWTETGAPTASRYYLNVYFNGKRVASKYYDAFKICDAAGTCKVPKPLTLKEGDYSWEIKPWNPVGYGPTATTNFSYHPDNGFNNHFDTDSEGITTMYPKWDWWWVDGSYLTTWYGANYTWASARIDTTYTDVDMTAVMYRDGDPYAANGIIIRGAPIFSYMKVWKTGYRFLYSNNGSYSVWKVYGGRDYLMQTWTYSAAINQNATNTLRVVAVGPDFYYYINGTLVWSGQDTTTVAKFTSGSAGILSFVQDWRDYKDYLYVDRITTSVPVILGTAETVSEEQLALNEAAQASPTGSAFGPQSSASDIQFFQSVPELNEITIQQKMESCLAKGDQCALPFPH